MYSLMFWNEGGVLVGEVREDPSYCPQSFKGRAVFFDADARLLLVAEDSSGGANLSVYFMAARCNAEEYGFMSSHRIEFRDA